MTQSGRRNSRKLGDIRRNPPRLISASSRSGDSHGCCMVSGRHFENVVLVEDHRWIQNFGLA
jgi:hypothetical protein